MWVCFFWLLHKCCGHKACIGREIDCVIVLLLQERAWSGEGSRASCSSHSLFFIVQLIAWETAEVNSAVLHMWRAAVYKQLTNSVGFSKEFRNAFQESASELGMYIGYSSCRCSAQKQKTWFRSVTLQSWLIFGTAIVRYFAEESKGEESVWKETC